MHARTTPTEGCALPLLYLCTSTSHIPQEPWEHPSVMSAPASLAASHRFCPGNASTVTSSPPPQLNVIGTATSPGRSTRAAAAAAVEHCRGSRLGVLLPILKVVSAVCEALQPV